MLGMNKLPVAKRIQILSILRGVIHAVDLPRGRRVSINTVQKISVDAARPASAWSYDQYVRNLHASESR